MENMSKRGREAASDGGPLTCPISDGPRPSAPDTRGKRSKRAKSSATEGPSTSPSSDSPRGPSAPGSNKRAKKGGLGGGSAAASSEGQQWGGLAGDYSLAGLIGDSLARFVSPQQQVFVVLSDSSFDSSYGCGYNEPSAKVLGVLSSLARAAACLRCASDKCIDEHSDFSSHQVYAALYRGAPGTSDASLEASSTPTPAKVAPPAASAVEGGPMEEPEEGLLDSDDDDDELMEKRIRALQAGDAAARKLTCRTKPYARWSSQRLAAAKQLLSFPIAHLMRTSIATTSSTARFGVI